MAFPFSDKSFPKLMMKLLRVEFQSEDSRAQEERGRGG